MMCIQCEQTIMSFNIGTEKVQYLTVKYHVGFLVFW